MSFLRKRFSGTKSKTKQVRGDAKLTLQEKVRKKDSSTTDLEPSATKRRQPMNLKGEITLLEEKLNSPDTRRSPTSHIAVIRRLAKNYLQLGKEEFSFYNKAENLYKQMNVLYPLHMEKIDWIFWIKASAKAKLIREARRLLSEARMLFPGDEEFDKVETDILHIASAESST